MLDQLDTKLKVSRTWVEQERGCDRKSLYGFEDYYEKRKKIAIFDLIP